MNLDDIRHRRVDELCASVTTADRERPVRRRLLDDGVPEAVLRRDVADAGRRRPGGALLQRKVEQRHVDGLPGFHLDLPRTFRRAAAGAGLRLCRDHGRYESG